MKAHRFIAIIVFIAAAIWVLTGDFSSVGGAVAQDEQEAQATIVESEVDPNAEQSTRIQSVGIVQIPRVDHARTIRISGVTEADKIVQLTAREDGSIAELAVAQGDVVETGDLIARIDPEGRDALVLSAEQAVEEKRAELEAKARLVEQGTLPRLQLDPVISQLRSAEADLKIKKAELTRLDITAPFGGVVDALSIEVGAAVGSGTGVGTLIALDPIIGRGSVNEGDLPIIRVGGTASLRLVNGTTVEGEIRFISRQADPATRTYDVEIEAPNPDLIVPAGMTTEIGLRGDEVRATPVPRSIVSLNDEGILGVRGVGDDNRTVFYPIDIVDDGADALLLAGIPENARIIVVGQNIVGDGQLVDPVDASPDDIERLINEARGEVASQ
ncbi:MAG: efflux RND transporter periplasmic adaptor subunit [Pseudomonadota bacterium]